MAHDAASSSDLPSAASPPPTTPSKPVTTSTESIDPETDSISSLHHIPRRPAIGSRQPSGSMIVPHDHPEIELKHETYGPNDARSFSPRRDIEDTEKMMGGQRSLLKSHADELQNGLNAIVEKVESVKSDHDKLERNNTALQDYIGGLTQSMSKTNLAPGASGRGGRTDAQNILNPQQTTQQEDGNVSEDRQQQRSETNTSRSRKECTLCKQLEEVHGAHPIYPSIEIRQPPTRKQRLQS